MALGGVGEFGKNLAVYSCDSQALIIDAGSTFPSAREPGVDLILPDFSLLDRCGEPLGCVITHAHEDHFGALPYLLQERPMPVWASPYTRACIERRLAEFDLGEVDLRDLPDSPEVIEVGPFGIEAIRVAHSIPHTRAIALHTPQGTILHTADFKLDDDPPDGEATDLERLDELADDGIRLLVSDSTNADREGIAESERNVVPALRRLLDQAPQRVVLTTFASNVQRMQSIADAADESGRSLILVGTAVQQHTETAERLGLLRMPPGLRQPAESLRDLPRRHVVIVASGSQGEPRSAMTRIAFDDHRQLSLEADDWVLHSARRIPGNEIAIGRVFNALIARGVRVITADDAEIHVSGHAAADDLRRCLRTWQPEFLLPVHGERQQQEAQRQLALECGLQDRCIEIPTLGQRFRLDADGLRTIERWEVGRRLMQQRGIEVDEGLIAERRRASFQGVVVVSVEIDAHDRLANGYPAVVSRGFTPSRGDESSMTEGVQRAVRRTFADWKPGRERSHSAMTETIERGVRRFLRRDYQQAPLVIAVIQQR